MCHEMKNNASSNEEQCAIKCRTVNHQMMMEETSRSSGHIHLVINSCDSLL